MLSRPAHHMLNAIALRHLQVYVAVPRDRAALFVCGSVCLFVESDDQWVLRFAVLCCACHTGAQTDNK